MSFKMDQLNDLALSIIQESKASLYPENSIRIALV
jgi:hypothetical protein